MVTQSPTFHFQSVIDDFLALKNFSGPHRAALSNLVHERAAALFEHPDIRYMPTFKSLDLLAEMVNLAAEIDQSPQLRANEATSLLRASISDNAPLIRQFILDAALERARYEPMMLSGAHDIPHRDLALRKRWRAMLDAHQELQPLPPEWCETLTHAAEAVITAESFHHFRQGPLMQLFAEMLQTARQLQQEQAPLDALEHALSKASPLWKRYALKATRYGEKPTDTPGTLPAESRVPTPPESPHIH